MYSRRFKETHQFIDFSDSNQSAMKVDIAVPRGGNEVKTPASEQTVSQHKQSPIGQNVTAEDRSMITGQQIRSNLIPGQ